MPPYHFPARLAKIPALKGRSKCRLCGLNLLRASEIAEDSASHVPGARSARVFRSYHHLVQWTRVACQWLVPERAGISPHCAILVVFCDATTKLEDACGLVLRQDVEDSVSFTADWRVSHIWVMTIRSFYLFWIWTSRRAVMPFL